MPSTPLEEARSYASLVHTVLRFTFGLKAFLRDPISVQAAKATVRQGVQTRDAALLRLVERAIFANRRSPYLKLFRAAGCELGDVRSLVKQEGVDGTLRRLLDSGVYVSFEEFKGQAVALRGSQSFTFRDANFDNPTITPHYYASTGGTRGRPTRLAIDLDFVAQLAPHWALWFAANDVLACPLVFWTSSHPAVVNHQLICAKFGNRFVKWFSTGGGGGLMYRLASAYVHGLARRLAGFSGPDFAASNEAGKVGEYLVNMVAGDMRPCVSTSPSAAVRVCLAMQERGLSLRNVTFMVISEPLTRARRQIIEAAGARVSAIYAFAEGGNVGAQCQSPAAADDVHIALDAYAVLQRARALGDGQAVQAQLFTAFRPACPKVMLNAEIGDYAIMETRQCGCLFDELGYHQHLHTIRSFQKLTGEGVAFIGADIFHLLEEILPRRFGGSLADYQLVESQDVHGLPQYRLLVSPEVGMLDEKTLITAFLEELGKLRRPYRFMASVWAQSDILRVSRQRPRPTTRGKVLPFLTLGRDDPPD